jgi:hypothetical protein
MANRKVGPSFTPSELADLYRLAGALWITLDITPPHVRAAVLRRQEDATILRDLFVGAAHRLAPGLAARVAQMAPLHLERILRLE